MSQVDQAFLKAFSKGRLPLESTTSTNAPTNSQAQSPHLQARTTAQPSSSIHVSQTTVRQAPSASVSNSRIDSKHTTFSSTSSSSTGSASSPMVPGSDYAPSSPIPPRRGPINPLLNESAKRTENRAAEYEPINPIWSPIEPAQQQSTSLPSKQPTQAKPISLKGTNAPQRAERVTLRSYFEQAKPEQISIREFPPNPIHTPESIDDRSQAVAHSDHQQEIPFVASRFAKNVAIHSAHPTSQQAPHHQLFPNQEDPNRDIYPAVHRAPEVNPWQGYTVERGIKGTADSKSIAAKFVDSPAKTNASPSRPFSSVEMESEAERVAAQWIAAKSGKEARSYRIDPPQIDEHQVAPQQITSPKLERPVDRPINTVADSTGFAPARQTTHFADRHDFEEPAYSTNLDSQQLWSRESYREAASTVNAAFPSTSSPIATKTRTHAKAAPEVETAQTEDSAEEQLLAPKNKSTYQTAAEPQLRVASPLQPVWEVDNFLWPSIVANLLESQKDSFEEIGLHLQHAQSKGLRVVSVTSGERGVGRSTVSMCLAKTVARTGLKVAIIDGDYECPSLVDQLNLEIEHGWQSCLLNNVPLEEAAVLSLSDHVCLFPLTESLSLTQVNRHEQRIQKLFKRIANAFDMVIIDANRLNQKQYQLLGTGKDSVVDAALVIVDAQLSLQQRVDNAIELLKSQGVQSIGLAENFHS